MSLDCAQAFYQALDASTTLRQRYLQACSDLPELPYLSEEHGVLRQWREEKILRFAAEQGYQFGLGDLYQVWFGREDYRGDREAPLGWRMRAIAALNRQMAQPLAGQGSGLGT